VHSIFRTEVMTSSSSPFSTELFFELVDDGLLPPQMYAFDEVDDTFAPSFGKMRSLYFPFLWLTPS